MIEIKKLPSETEEQFLWKIGQMVDAGKIESWSSVNEIVNREILGDDEDKYRTESAWRKRYQEVKHSTIMYSPRWKHQNIKKFYKCC